MVVPSASCRAELAKGVCTSSVGTPAELQIDVASANNTPIHDLKVIAAAG
jgi:hypothetical protein